MYIAQFFLLWTVIIPVGLILLGILLFDLAAYPDPDDFDDGEEEIRG